MKAFVITIMDNEKSVQAANRCIKSAKKYDLSVDMFHAVTPKDNPERMLNLEWGVDTTGFKRDERYSRRANAIAAFASHYSLWKLCAEDNEDYLILEHDAVFKGAVPKPLTYSGLMSLGHPSYGKFHMPARMGENPLTSKAYFPGAHAYMISPEKAKIVMDKAKRESDATDVFLHRSRFPFLTEYYPWPIVADDNFTTIQKERGCLAKHNYGETYEII